jgi:hypothetical protein
MMDWNTFLFIAKWIAIGLFYAVLLLLLFGVYQEMARGVRKRPVRKSTYSGRLRVLTNGSDPRIQEGSILYLKSETRLGADEDNDIFLQDSFVAKHHASLKWDGATWWVEDFNSSNGTLVNKQTCVRGSAYPLPNGAILSIGGMTFQLLDADGE